MTKLFLKLVSDLNRHFIAVKYCEGPKTFQATQFENLQIISMPLGEACYDHNRNEATYLRHGVDLRQSCG